VTVITTYLHLPSRAQFCPTTSDTPDRLILAAREPLVAFARFLYAVVGRDYYWIDRHAWSDTAWQNYLTHPGVTQLVLYLRGTPAGYIELNAAAEEPGTEVAYFGIIPAFQGRGLGKHLLSHGVQHAFDNGAERVWLHTCTLDGPHAQANYQARGFIPYRTTTHEQVLPVGMGGQVAQLAASPDIQGTTW
jgi:ribosomal protein S18 acetylase RimI-like enzyme